MLLFCHRQCEKGGGADPILPYRGHDCGFLHQASPGHTIQKLLGPDFESCRNPARTRECNIQQWQSGVCWSI